MSWLAALMGRLVLPAKVFLALGPLSVVGRAQRAEAAIAVAISCLRKGLIFQCSTVSSARKTEWLWLYLIRYFLKPLQKGRLYQES